MKFLIYALLTISITACNKYPGEGGSSEISGIVIAQKYNAQGEIIEEYPLMDERVYIVYGEESNISDDNTRTSYDGSFRFAFLKKGKYQIFVYSKCPSCPGGDEAIIEKFEIDQNKQKRVLPTFYVRQ